MKVTPAMLEFSRQNDLSFRAVQALFNVAARANEVPSRSFVIRTPKAIFLCEPECGHRAYSELKDWSVDRPSSRNGEMPANSPLLNAWEGNGG